MPPTGFLGRAPFEPFQATWIRPPLPTAICPPRIVPIAIAEPGWLLTRTGVENRSVARLEPRIEQVAARRIPLK